VGRLLKRSWRLWGWAVDVGLVVDCGGRVKALGEGTVVLAYLDCIFFIFIDFCSLGNIGSLYGLLGVMVDFLPDVEGGLVAATWAVVRFCPVDLVIWFSVLVIGNLQDVYTEIILHGLYHVGGGLVG